MRKESLERLRNLGYPTYAAYLASPRWKGFSARVRARRCYACRGGGGRRGLQIHHLTYDRVGRELASDVVTLCPVCHKRLHKLVQKGKAPLATAHESLRRKLLLDRSSHLKLLRSAFPPDHPRVLSAERAVANLAREYP